MRFFSQTLLVQKFELCLRPILHLNVLNAFKPWRFRGANLLLAVVAQDTDSNKQSNATLHISEEHLFLQPVTCIGMYVK